MRSKNASAVKAELSTIEAKLSVAASNEVFHGIKAETRNIAEPTDFFSFVLCSVGLTTHFVHDA